jgi:single-stranded-DNA-specific exonuclease
MYPPAADWQLKSQPTPSDWLLDLLQKRSPNPSNSFAAQLLWQRGLQDPQSVLAFLDATHYQPTSPWAFGAEMDKAVARLQEARDRQEMVFIWGDFDADGITATAVLWEGLGQFFERSQTLHFTIPNRLKESHGLSIAGIDAIASHQESAARGCQLIVTCDTGSSNEIEIDYAQKLGIDIIITDHHTLPNARPAVAAFLNPRTFSQDHPLANLSGVAVAYKLVEALYESLPDIPQEPLENLLDLVAIGLIADLVKLTGDCRYLAQRGLARLKTQLDAPTRPGVAKMLELCRRTGDRPTDIAFGLGPRINAISRIQGDAREGVKLLTTRDPERATVLAESAEWTNLCRKEVQQRVQREAETQLARLDVDATAVIVLSDAQWPVGVLGLVASQLAQTYGRPTILLSEARSADTEEQHLLRGSARSVKGIDLYDLLQQQAHLLHRFGGHPFAAGLSLPVENLPMFIASINQSFRQRLGQWTMPALEVDLEICVADLAVELGASLFRALQQLEPYGMGNPSPKLLLRNCWLERRRGSRYQSFANQKLQFKKTQFQLRDDSSPERFDGVWWGHDADELPDGPCDVVVELEYGKLYQTSAYHARLIAVRATELIGISHQTYQSNEPWLLDWRTLGAERSQFSNSPAPDVLCIEACPTQWDDLTAWVQRAKSDRKKLALAYPTMETPTAVSIWQQLAGMAKYAARTQQSLALTQVRSHLNLTERSLLLGFEALKAVGFELDLNKDVASVRGQTRSLTERESPSAVRAIERFMDAIDEDHFLHHYFQRTPVERLQQIMEQRLMLG